MKKNNSMTILGIVGLIVASIFLSPEPAKAGPAYQSEANMIYLPVTLRQIPSLSGRVTMNGSPASGVSLELRFYDGSSWSTRASTATDATGFYIFDSVPALQSGQRYYVRYLNTTDTSRLFRWDTPVYTTYGTAPMVIFDTFDIADIVLQSPQPGEVSLPVTFTWASRPATPNDNYEFNLYDPTDNDPFFYTAPPLGNVTSYTLGGLPAGFVYGVEYGWFISVYGPDGGYGESYYSYGVIFR